MEEKPLTEAELTEKWFRHFMRNRKTKEEVQAETEKTVKWFLDCHALEVKKVIEAEVKHTKERMKMGTLAAERVEWAAKNAYYIIRFR